MKQPPRLGNFMVKVRCPVALTEDQRIGMMRSVHQCLVENTLLSGPHVDVELVAENSLPGVDARA